MKFKKATSMTLRVSIIALVLLAGTCFAVNAVDISFYTSIHPDVVKAVMEKFKGKNPDINVNLYRAGSGTIWTKIQMEAKTGRIIPDIIHTADPSAFVQMKRNGWLLSYDSPHMKTLIYPEHLVDKDHQYYPVRISVPVLVYNIDSGKPNISKLEELPKIAGPSLAVPTPLQSGTIACLVYFTHEQFGEDGANKFWLTLKEKDTHFGPWADALGGVARGEFKYGITSIDQANRMRWLSRERIGIIYLDSSSLNPCPIAIVAYKKEDSKKIEASKRLMDFWLSKEGQQEVSEMYILAARKGVKAKPGFPFFEEIHGKFFDAEKYSDRYKDLMRWWKVNMGR